MITLNYTLGVYPAYNGTVAKLSQYSNDFTLVFTLVNDYGDFVLEDGTTAQIRGTKADGNGYSANCTIDIEAQTVTVTGDEQITAAAGDNTFEIRLIKNEKILNTVNFTIWVERAALDAGTITSDSVLLELNAIIEGAQTAAEAAASAAESAEEAATSAATLRLDPTLTQSGESADAKVVGDALAFGLAARYDSASPYAVGDYMLKDNVLYRVTQAIPAGGAVTVGTNVEIAPLGNAVTTLKNAVTALKNAVTALNSKQSDTAGFHNGIYRGKNITSYLSDGTLWNRIKGTGGYALFEDLYLGDYITVGSNSYAIVDFDYYLRCGSVDLNEHHIVMMPTGNMNIPEGTALYGVSGQTLQFINTANAGVTVSSQESATGFKWNAKMSDPNTNNTNGGYKYSRMRQVIMKAANTIVINAFGSSHVKPITVLYPNPSSETASGIASGWAWFANDDQSAADAKSLCDLPNETQIYGQQVWGRGTVYTNMGYEVGTDKFQFAICALQRNFVDTRARWWLRSVDSASYAAVVSYDGGAGYDGAAYAYWVRPRFLLVG